MRILTIVLLSILLLACASAQDKRDADRIAKSNVELGIGYLRQGKTDAALEKMQRALKASPDSPDVHSSIALVYQQMNELENSKRHYERALELQPENGVIHNNYAALLCRMGKPLEAEPHFLQAIKSRGYHTPAQALENLGICLFQIPDYEKAEEYLRQALQIDPQLPKALLEMARISLVKERFMSGRAYLQRFQAVAQMTPEALWLGIQVETKLGDKQAVSNYETQLLRKFPDSDQTKQLLDRESGAKAELK